MVVFAALLTAIFCSNPGDITRLPHTLARHEEVLAANSPQDPGPFHLLQGARGYARQHQFFHTKTISAGSKVRKPTTISSPAAMLERDIPMTQNSAPDETSGGAHPR